MLLSYKSQSCCNQSTLTYDKSLSNCRILEAWCKQFKKAKEKGHTELNTITLAIATSSSIHQDTLNIQCTTCGHSHPPTNCTVYGKRVIIVAIKTILQAHTEEEDLKDNPGTAENNTKPALIDTIDHTVGQG